MRIAIDARWIFRQISGIGAYTRALTGALARLDADNEYVLFFHFPDVRIRTQQELGLTGRDNFRGVMLPHNVFSPYSQLSLPLALRRERIDVYHSPNYMIPFAAFPRRRRGRTRCVATVHDVIPLRFTDHAPRSRKSRLYPLYKLLMRELGVRADALIAVSDTSRRDVLHYLHIPPAAADKVRTVYCGVDRRFSATGLPPPRPSDAPRTVLYVGRLDPYKNVPTLVRAFARAAAEAPFPLRLTMVGARDPRYPEAERLAGELGLAGAMRWTGYVSDEELLRLYRQADVLVHPSRYEGFGLQVVEAMACGLPVVCSNAGSLAEVAGEAALLVDPDDEAGFTRAMLDVLLKPELAQRLIVAGLSRSARFTWERAARETLALYRELGGEARGK